MEIPYTFDDNEKPDLDNNSGSKLKPGRYNIEFVRVANSEDKAETIEFNGKTIEGVVTGKNDWKGQKLMFSVLDTPIKQLQSVILVFDYDASRTYEDGNSMRDNMIKNGQTLFKKLCHRSGSDLSLKSLVGRKLSCEFIEYENGYLKMDPGNKGDNFGIFEMEAQEPKTEKVEDKADPKPESLDDEIPF